MRLTPIRAFAACLLALLPLCAAESVTLTNGMRLSAESIERDGERVILHTSGGGVIEMPADRIAAIEHLPDAAPPARTAAAVQAAPPALKSVPQLISEAAERYGLPTAIVNSVARAESALNPKAISPKGAVGVMQLMPATARMLDADPSDAVQNIDAGTRLLRDLLLKYEGAENGVRRALAAYNAGPAAVDRYNGVPPYRETQNYVERVIGLYWQSVGHASDASGTK